jgi:hypothetical protein
MRWIRQRNCMRQSREQAIRATECSCNVAQQRRADLLICGKFFIALDDAGFEAFSSGGDANIIDKVPIDLSVSLQCERSAGGEREWGGGGGGPQRME